MFRKYTYTLNRKMALLFVNEISVSIPGLQVQCRKQENKLFTVSQLLIQVVIQTSVEVMLVLKSVRTVGMKDLW